MDSRVTIAKFSGTCAIEADVVDTARVVHKVVRHPDALPSGGYPAR